MTLLLGENNLAELVSCDWGLLLPFRDVRRDRGLDLPPTRERSIPAFEAARRNGLERVDLRRIRMLLAPDPTMLLGADLLWVERG